MTVPSSHHAKFLVMPSQLTYNEDYFSKDDSIIRSRSSLYEKEVIEEEMY